MAASVGEAGGTSFPATTIGLFVQLGPLIPSVKSGSLAPGGNESFVSLFSK
jgi:hypothetical protein